MCILAIDWIVEDPFLLNILNAIVLRLIAQLLVILITVARWWCCKIFPATAGHCVMALKYCTQKERPKIKIHPMEMLNEMTARKINRGTTLVMLWRLEPKINTTERMFKMLSKLKEEINVSFKCNLWRQQQIQFFYFYRGRVIAAWTSQMGWRTKAINLI